MKKTAKKKPPPPQKRAVKRASKKAKKPPTEKRPKEGYMVCEDCGGEYMIGIPHYMFCSARTCEECGTTTSSVIEKDDEGRRVCESCQSGELDGEDYLS